MVDGHSVYQYARDYCNVPENKISLYGLSLGGGVIGKLKPLLTTHNGKVVIDRSFGSLGDIIYKVAKKIVADNFTPLTSNSLYTYLSEHLTTPLAYFLWAILAPALWTKEGIDYFSSGQFSLLVSSLCAYTMVKIAALHSWVMNTKESLEASQNLLILFHKSDTMIPYEYNIGSDQKFHHRCKELFGNRVTIIARSEWVNNSRTITTTTKEYPNTHCIPLNHLTTQEGALASREIFQFLVS